jgi:hypothetical protein
LLTPEEFDRLTAYDRFLVVVQEGLADAEAVALLRQRGRVAYRILKRPLQLDDTALEDSASATA